MLKIYPCLVVRGTKVYDWWKNGEYKPLTTRDAVELVAKVKESVPSWMRIMRVQREIPARLIEAGPNKGNLRELALASLAEKGKHCRCIRCREVGHHGLKESPNGVRTAFDLVTTRYVSSGGIEIFLSKEDQVSDTLVGYLRLRIPSSSAHRAELTVEPASIVRELHVYGPAIPIGEHDRDWWQHKGHGLSLLCEAERISREEYSIRKILVLSAIGTREYYARNGYKRDGPYMSKQL
jgi:elongator complex protein 3